MLITSQGQFEDWDQGYHAMTVELRGREIRARMPICAWRGVLRFAVVKKFRWMLVEV